MKNLILFLLPISIFATDLVYETYDVEKINDLEMMTNNIHMHREGRAYIENISHYSNTYENNGKFAIYSDISLNDTVYLFGKSKIDLKRVLSDFNVYETLPDYYKPVEPGDILDEIIPAFIIERDLPDYLGSSRKLIIPRINAIDYENNILPISIRVEHSENPELDKTITLTARGDSLINGIPDFNYILQLHESQGYKISTIINMIIDLRLSDSTIYRKIYE